MRILASLRGLRGTRFDLFGYTTERRMERRLISDFEKLVEALVSSLDSSNIEQAREIIALTMDVRGYGPVKEISVAEYKSQLQPRLQAYMNVTSEAA